MLEYTKDGKRDLNDSPKNKQFPTKTIDVVTKGKKARSE